MACTVIIPTRNRPHGLRAAVASALEALPPDGEVLVVDDGSCRPAAETLRDLARPALRVAENTGPRGPSAARNLGARLARNPVLVFLDDDDRLLPHYCDAVLSRLPALPAHCGFGFCATLNDVAGGSLHLHRARLSGGVHHAATPLVDRIAGLGMGFWIRRELFLGIGGIDEALRVNEDTELSIRLAAAGAALFYDPEPGVVLTHDTARAGGDAPSITRSAPAGERARGFEHILTQHRQFLLGHGRFRRLFLARVLKYRSRARDLAGWRGFCRAHHPRSEGLLLRVVGTPWLRFSIAMRQRRDAPASGGCVQDRT